MQVADSPFASSLSHYHSYYQFHPPGTHDHELKRQYLSLLPPKQIIEICLTFDAYVPPYAKTTVWPHDLNVAIAGLQKIASSLSETSKSASDNSKPPEAQEASASEPESSKTGEPPPTDNQKSTSASESLTVPQLSPSAVPNPQNSSNTESQETQVTPAPTTQAQHAPAVPNPSPSAYPFGYGHLQVAYPHAPYYASGYPYPYSYPPPVRNGQTSPSAPSPFPSHPAPYGAVFPPAPPEASGNDDLPSYEEMIVEALSECTDPDGWVPKDLFTWMAARYPLQSNFRPSASQALQKAYKRGRFEKGTNGKYRLSTSWEGGSTSRRTTRRPQTQNHASSSSASRTSVPPFTHAPLVHHHHTPHVVPPGNPPGQPPYPMAPYGYPGYPGYIHQPPASTPNVPGTNHSIERPNTSTTAGDSAAAYEAAQSILKAINFGGLLKLPPEEDEPKKEGASQLPYTGGNSVEHLLSHVQAVLASRNSEGAAATSGSLPGMVAEATPSVLPSPSVQVPENKRAELQAQLALLSAQLAELAQIEEPRDPTVTVGNLPDPPMHSLIPDESSSLLQALRNVSTSTMTTLSPAVDHPSTNRSGVIAASIEEDEAESDEDDMEAVI